ncbi:MAG: DUF1501 domain-containing protein, partial [Bryobacteraceae bacterium]
MKDRFGFVETTGTQFWRRPHLGRRMFFRHVASAVGGYFLMPSRPLEVVARAAVAPKNTAKNCIFVMMEGGPSHVDTFDLKEGSWTPQNFNATSYGDLRWPQGLMPALAEQLESITLVRSMKAWAAVHGLAQAWVQIGRNPAASTSKIAPHIGSVVALELGKQESGKPLPPFVALNTRFGVGAGYLPAQNNPFYVSPNGNAITNTRHGSGVDRFERRYGLLMSMDDDLRLSGELGAAPAEMFAYNAAARRLIYNSAVEEIFIFDQNERNRYGATAFGNGCIAARNLLRARAGVRFIQISQGNWDHHANIYTSAANTSNHTLLAQQFDKALGTLIADLKADGLLDETLVVAFGEFGRVPGTLNPGRGRDHYLNQAALVAGGGVLGGRAIG